MNVFNNVNVVIQQGQSSQPITTHIDNLKKYQGPTPTDFTMANEQNNVPPLDQSQLHIDTEQAEQLPVPLPDSENR